MLHRKAERDAAHSEGVVVRKLQENSELIADLNQSRVEQARLVKRVGILEVCHSGSHVPPRPCC